MHTQLTAVENRLPEGFTARPVILSDLQAAVDLMNIYSQWERGEQDALPESVQEDWSHPVFHLETNTLAVFSPQGQMVAYAEFWDNSQLHVIYFVFAVVHPEYQGKGLEDYLHEWSVARGKQATQNAPEDARVEIRRQTAQKAEVAAFLNQKGFVYARTFYRMRINFSEPVQPPALPQGITIRAIRDEEEKRAALYAAYESFRDHWGVMQETFEQYLQRWMEYIAHASRHDPDLWFIALDRSEIAGISLCVETSYEDPNMGWVSTLGVRRPWRKHGVGLALLQHSFWVLNQRGKPSVGLGVDAASLTGATRLYERAGMYVDRRFDTYIYELRPGKDYTIQGIEE